MKLLFSATSYLPAIGGAQLYLHGIALQLADRHELSVVSQWDQNRTDWLLGTTLRAPNEPRQYEIDGLAVHRIGLSYGEKLSILPSVLAYYAAQGPAIDILSRPLVHRIGMLAEGADLIHNLRIGREPLSFASYLVSRELGVPFFLTPFHHPRWQGWLYRHFRRLYRLADGVLALTSSEKATLASLGVDERRITVTGMGPIVAEDSDGGSFRESHGIEGPLVLFLGQKFRHKNIGALLSAASLVWQRRPDVHLVFIGPRTSYSRILFRRANDRRILELDTVTLQEKTNALAACDVLCLPSTQESFGGVFLEAWMMQKPVIGADIPAVSEVISHEIDGLVVDPRPNGIAEGILFLLENPAVAEEMGRRGQAKVLSHYTWDRISRRTEEAYDRALRRTSQTGMGTRPSRQ